jgi:hypothetical protein
MTAASSCAIGRSALRLGSGCAPKNGGSTSCSLSTCKCWSHEEIARAVAAARTQRQAATSGDRYRARYCCFVRADPQGFRFCLGIVRLVRPFGADRLEAAATRAIEIGTLTYGSVRSILNNKLDRQAGHRPPAEGVPLLHPNIRGPRYYH